MARFLISRLSSFGDVVCSLPAASALKAGFNDAHVTWVVDERFAPVVEACSAVDEVVPRKREVEGSFDAALDLQGLLKSAILVARAEAKEKVGYHWQREGSALFSRRVLPDPSSVHVVDQYVDVARAIGGKADRADFALHAKPPDIQSMQAKLPNTTDLIVLNPCAAWESKRWPVAYFADLIGKLTAIGLHCVLIGGRDKADIEVSKTIGATASGYSDMIGRTSLGELIALIGLAEAYVGGDTGSTHTAAALGIPTVGLYWATRPERSGPYGQIERCHYAEDGRQISPDDVLRSVVEAIK